MTFPLAEQQKILELVDARLPEETGVIVIFVTPAPEYGEGAAQISTTTTLHPEIAFRSILEVARRHVMGENPDPQVLTVQ